MEKWKVFLWGRRVAMWVGCEGGPVSWASSMRIQRRLLESASGWNVIGIRYSQRSRRVCNRDSFGGDTGRVCITRCSIGPVKSGFVPRELSAQASAAVEETQFDRSQAVVGTGRCGKRYQG